MAYSISTLQSILASGHETPPVNWAQLPRIGRLAQFQELRTAFCYYIRSESVLEVARFVGYFAVLTKRIYKEREMETQFLLSIAVALVMSTCALPAGPQPSRITAIENAFNDRSAVEAIISCFMGNTECTSQQDEIKARAVATMLNFGTCPRRHCTPEESAEMERSMELLQSKHPDLWTQLIFSILGIDIKDLGRRR